MSSAPIGQLVAGVLSTGVKVPQMVYKGDPFLATRLYGRATHAPMAELDGVAIAESDLGFYVRKNGTPFGAVSIHAGDATHKTHIGTNLSDFIMTGKCQKTATSTAVVGTDTLFTTQIAVGESIQIAVTGESQETREVTVITDDTHLTVDIAFDDTLDAKAYRKGYAVAVQVEDGDYFDIEVVGTGPAPNEGVDLVWVVA